MCVYTLQRINYSYMKKLKYLAISPVLAAMPFVAAAQTVDSGGQTTGFLNSILNFINAVLIPFILGVAFLIFVWGMFQYFIAGGSNEEAKEKGKSLLTYAILGFVVILVFWGIVNLVTDATGLEGQTLQGVPTVNVGGGGGGGGGGAP